MALQELLPRALLMLTLLLLSPSPIISSSTLDSFLACFNSFPSNATAAAILHTPSSPSFDAVLLSTADNKRTLLANTSHRPLAIVTPTAPSHAQAAVLCCRRTGLGLRTRSGGHDYEGLSFVSTSAAPFVVVDVGGLRDVAVDVGGGTAWAGAGAIVGELYYGVAKATPTLGFPGSTCPSVGLGGLLGGGGIGTLLRKYGVSADNVVDAVLVDAEGRLLDRAAMGEDLFWAIRGGGAASFGIVLSYKVKLVPVPPQVTVFAVWRTLEQNATRILSKWEQIGSKLSDDLFIRAAAIAINNGAGGRTVGVRFQCLFLGGKANLLAYLSNAFPELGIAAGDLTEMSYLDSVRFIADLMSRPAEALIDRTPEIPGSSFKAKSDFVQVPIGERGFASIWDLLLSSTTEPGMLIMEPFGGVMDTIPEGATPFPHRKGNLYIIQYFMSWTETDAAVTQRHLDWMRKLYSFMAPFVSKNPRGAYLNYRDIDLGRNGKGRCSGAQGWGRQYFKGNFERLVRVKGAVDPKGFFSSEQSIPTTCA